eukprot:gene8300-biopygen83
MGIPLIGAQTLWAFRFWAHASYGHFVFWRTNAVAISLFGAYMLWNSTFQRANAVVISLFGCTNAMGISLFGGRTGGRAGGRTDGRLGGWAGLILSPAGGTRVSTSPMVEHALRWER